MGTMIIGMGEVGKALSEILSVYYEVIEKDIDPIEFKGEVDVMHVCIRYSEKFMEIVDDYKREYNPKHINICSTVPPGTTRMATGWGCHSTTRGLHPSLNDGLKTIKKHIGGNDAPFFAEYFENVGIPCIIHQRPETTELAHILNNVAYGVNLMFADEMAKLCREYGVDYWEAVMKYTHTNNMGYEALDHKSKCRMILTPPGGKIGGHCVVQSANLIPEGKRTPILKMLAKYNETDHD